jgi:(E)-4-hydroxy-3-methylbut-2-enyl-diphosphate synthase
MLTYALQKEGDAIDVRNILHRDGSVVSAVSLSQLANPDKLYYDMGCKTAVGMPFKVVLLGLLALLVQMYKY